MSRGNTEQGTASAGATTVDYPAPANAGKSSIGRKILAVFLAALVAFIAFVAVQSPNYRITRSATMSAPPAKVFAQVNDFHNWEAWSPWAKLDPQAKNSFDGPSEGKGAIFAWDGNDEVGTGRMTLIESHPNELIRIKLEFKRPMEDTSTAEFTFVPKGDQTLVTWSMFGQNNFIGRAICLVMNMDKMLGGNFETGLAQMKAVVEAKPTP